MRESNENKIYAYDGNLALSKDNWKCATCTKYKGLDKACFTGHVTAGNIKTIYPDKRLEHTDECSQYECIKNDLKYTGRPEYKLEITNTDGELPLVEYDKVNEDTDSKQLAQDMLNKNENLINNLRSALDEERNYSVNTSIPDVLEVKCSGNGKNYTATVVMDPSWDNDMKEIAIEKAKATLNETIIKEAEEIQFQVASQNEQMKQDLIATRTKINDILNSMGEATSDEESVTQPVNKAQEEMLDGKTKIRWFSQVTSWNRVVNAARRTIGKKAINKEPSDSWKAKILLAEHSPIRLLEYDWGWEKIRQWVSVHLVRHHIGVEKFVHSQRGDRRELPCDRDHIYQGAKNDMDMTANAQGLINMSRKRCCNCASAETREAWNMVLDELNNVDPILKSKCVPECIYRGFCPEWMSKCGYWKTDSYKIKRAEYKNTKYGLDVKYKVLTLDNFDVNISNTGHAYNTDGIEFKYTNKFEDGHNVVYVGSFPVCCYVIMAFTDFGLVNEKDVLHLDGNEWNNNIDNLKVVNHE